DSWFLERLDPSGPVRVVATLTSANPASFDISGGATTDVRFTFATDGTVVTMDAGVVAVSVGVEERDRRGELTLLAGKIGGFGSGDGIGLSARFFDPT